MTVNNAIIYCRVSSKKQTVEGSGLQSQEARCREFAAYRGMTVKAVFMDDVSGAEDDRPAMNALLGMLRAARKEPHVVIVDDISRLARDILVHRKYKDAIERLGGKLMSPNGQFADADDPDQEFFESMSALGAEHYRKKNRKVTKDRRRSRLIGGYWPFNAPVGYLFEKMEGQGKVLVPNPPVASVIKEAFESFASGRFQTRAEVARFLSSHPRWKGSNVTIERVNELFSRPLYAGVIDYPLYNVRMVPGKHHGIVSLEVYSAVQKRMEAKAYVPARKDINEDFPLRNFVECDDCGEAFKACWSKGRSKYHPYYLCQTRGCASYGKSVRRDVLESQFEALLEELRPSATLVRLATMWFEELWHKAVANLGEDKAILLEEVAEVDRQISMVVERIMTSSSNAVIETYERKIEMLELQKRALDEKIANCGRALPDFDDTHRTALKFVSDPKILWKSSHLEDKRAVLKLAFDGRLRYRREHGYRTAKVAEPLRLFSTSQIHIGGGAGGRNRTDTPFGTGF
jgi:site-specific DNA recombinase